MGQKKTKKQIKKDIVSVITTFYNAQTFILNAVNSVMQQQHTDRFDIEYVIVDDKSPDNSRKMLEAFLEKHNNPNNINVRIIEPEQNLGCGGARKFGIENATGNFLMFLDADDYYMKVDFVKRAYEEIISENADIVEFGMVFNQPNGQQVNSCVGKKMIVENPHLAEILLFKDNAIKFNVWTKIYRKELCNKFEYSTERIFEDVRTIPVWVSLAKKIVIMPSCEVNYRAAGGSIIRDDVLKTRLGTITGIASLFERFKDDKQVLKAMYGRAMVDLTALLDGHSSNNPGFNQMSQLNTYMLRYIYPDTYKKITYNVEDDPNASPYREET
jgi:glycosyltransferase involved in cell wall biosynthesis